MAERSPLDLMLATIPPPKQGDSLNDVIKWAGLYSSQMASHYNRLQKVLRQGTGIALDRLAILGDQSKYLRLTSQGAGQARLEALGFGTTGGSNQEVLELRAPNASSSMMIGPFGNAGFAGTTPQPGIVWNLQKLDYNDSVNAVRVLNSNVTQAGSGDAPTGALLLLDMTGTASSASGANANTLRGFTIGLAGGAVGNANFSGQIIGSVMAVRALRSAVGAVGDQICYDAFGSFQTTWTSISLRATIANQIGFRCLSPNNTGGGVTTNLIGFQSGAFIQGTNRVGFQALGMITGAPAVAYGFESLHHTVGVLKRSFVGDESIESRQQHVIVNTAGKMLVVRDTADGNLYGLNTTLGVLNAPVNLGPGPIAA